MKILGAKGSYCLLQYLKRGAITVCYLNDYEDTQSIVAEFKKIVGARYPKEISRMALSKKMIKSKAR